MDTFKSRVWIEGRGWYNLTFDPIEGQSAPPVSNVTRAFPGGNGSAGDEETVSVTLVGHDMKTGVSKTGKNAGKPYEKHSFRGSDNRKYDTFDERKVTTLTPLVNTGTPVKMIVRANAYKSWDIQRIETA